MADGDQPKFSLWRSLLWPVHRSEFKRVISMLVLLFLLCICYSLLRNLKDTIILTAKSSGAEVIPFLKVWGMLPGAFFATWVYSKLSSKFTREKVFYLMTTGFLSYFLLFAFVLYPNSDALHLSSVGDWLSSHLPAGFKGFIAMIRNWTFTSFYIISELWSVLLLTVLFWGFANDITGVSQAKRTYGILNIGSNIAPVFGGALGILFSKNFSIPLPFITTDQWGQTLINLIILLNILGVLAMGLFYWINRGIQPHELPKEKQEKKEKIRLSVRESIRYLAKNKYLISLAFIVLGYNIAINLTDILWKEQLKRFFTDPNAMLEHMNQITVGIGIVATVGAVFFSFMINRLGWTFTAILTPMLMSTLAIGFFVFLFSGDGMGAIAASLFGASPLALTVYFGSLQNCLSKAGKYSVFDATKELAFLPLDAESRLKGKAAIDGLGSGLGKSGASLTYQGFIILLGSVALSTPYIAALLFVVFVIWISSVIRVGGAFKKMTVADAPIPSTASLKLSE
jgi:AAA family ATP:ADP antiporter